MSQPCQAGHQIFQPTCKKCRDLRSEWYQYLEKTGFVDIENLNGDIIDHKTPLDLIKFKDFQTAHQFQAKQNYYQWARSKLSSAQFKTTKDKLIWEHHSEGLSTRQISPRVGLEQSWTCRRINKIKTYLMNSIGSMSYATA